MKRLSISLPALAGVGTLVLAVGIGIGRMGKGTAAEGATETELRAGGNAATLEPSAVTGQSAAEKAARAEVRPFQPGRPFPRGGAEKWLLGLREESLDGWDHAGISAIFHQLGTLDTGAAREVLDAALGILGRMEAEDDDETMVLWGQHEEKLTIAVASAFGIVAREDPEGALALLDAREELTEDLVSMVWSELARSAPGRVEALLAGIDEKDGVVFPRALIGAVLGLARSDPEAAMALLEKYPVEDFEIMRRNLIERVMATDPRLGIELAAGLVRDGEAVELRSAFGDWLDTDEEAARAWLEQYDGPGRNAARGTLLRNEVSTDPRAAMEEYDAMRASGATDSDLEGVAGAIAANLVISDPTATRAWVEALPEGENRTGAVAALAHMWAEVDAPAASEWIATLPAGEARDQAVFLLAETIKDSDPAAALHWAGLNDHEGARHRQTRDILKSWFEQDPVAAGAAAAALPAEERRGNIKGGAVNAFPVEGPSPFPIVDLENHPFPPLPEGAQPFPTPPTPGG